MPRAPGLGPSGWQNLSSANPNMCLGGTNPNMPLGSQNPSMCLGCGTSNSVPFGPQLGGVTPQAASMQEVLGIVLPWHATQTSVSPPTGAGGGVDGTGEITGAFDQ